MKLDDVKIGQRYFYKFRIFSEGGWSCKSICVVLAKKRRVKIKHLNRNPSKISWVNPSSLSKRGQSLMTIKKFGLDQDEVKMSHEIIDTTYRRWGTK